VPRLSPVIRDGHQRKRKSIRVEWNDEALPIEDKGMGARHPAEPALELIRPIASEGKLTTPSRAPAPVQIFNFLLLRFIPLR